MKVLVTGADGFIGSHLTEKLITEGHQVKAFVYYNSFNTWGWLDTVPKKSWRKSRFLPATSEILMGCERPSPGRTRYITWRL